MVRHGRSKQSTLLAKHSDFVTPEVGDHWIYRKKNMGLHLKHPSCSAQSGRSPGYVY